MISDRVWCRLVVIYAVVAAATLGVALLTRSWIVLAIASFMVGVLTPAPASAARR